MNGRIVPVWIYVTVFCVLIGLTLTTTLVARLDLGPLNVVAAMTIAVIKAVLVALFFMHLMHSEHRTMIMVSAGILWLIILISLTLSDVLTRNWVPVARPW